MDRRFFGRAGFGLLGALLMAPTKAAASSKTHRIVMQVDTEDRKAQQLVLGNVHNLAAFYRAKGEPFAIEIVAFGPGFSMVRGDVSMLKGEIEAIQKDLGSSLKIAACQNTRKAIAKSEGKRADDIPLLPGVVETPSGVARIVELQEQEWIYVRP